MSHEDKKDPRLGRTARSFPEAPSFGWLLILLGLAAVSIGVVALGLTFESLGVATRHAREEVALGLALTLAFLSAGLGASAWGVLHLTRKPAWHLCDGGIVRLSTAGAAHATFWTDVSSVVVVRRMRSGRPVGAYLRVGKRLIAVPDEAGARQGHALWAAARKAA